MNSSQPHRRRIVRLGVFATTLCIFIANLSGNRGSAEELLSLYLNRVSPGEFPTSDWFPENRPSIDEELPSMIELVEQLTQLDPQAVRTLKLAYADRVALVRRLDLSNLRSRIDEVCKSNQTIIEKLQRLSWANATDDTVPMAIVQQRYPIQALAYLTNVYAVRELSKGRAESASRTMAGGFAFAHNLMRTSGDLNLILGITFQSVLIEGVADLQSMGAADMRPVLSRLGESMIDQQFINRSLWKEVCLSMPILVDRPRTSAQWRQELEATYDTFTQANLVPETDAEAEQLGRQLQTWVQVGKRVKALGFPVKYEHGGLAEAKELKPGQRLRLEFPGVLSPLTEYVEKSLDPTVIDRAHTKLLQRLCGLQCVELLRAESAKRGQWVATLNAAFLDAIPSPRGTIRQPTITIFQGVNQMPSYEIRFPESNFLAGFFQSPHESKCVAVEVEQEF